MLANPWKWDGIRNQEKEYYFSDIFSLRSKKPQRNIIIKILWAIKDQKKDIYYSLEMNLNYTTVDISKELGRSDMVLTLNFLSFPLSYVRDTELSGISVTMTQ